MSETHEVGGLFPSLARRLWEERPEVITVADVANAHYAEVVSLRTIGSSNGGFDTRVRRRGWVSRPSLRTHHRGSLAVVYRNPPPSARRVLPLHSRPHRPQLQGYRLRNTAPNGIRTPTPVADRQRPWPRGWRRPLHGPHAIGIPNHDERSLAMVVGSRHYVPSLYAAGGG